MAPNDPGLRLVSTAGERVDGLQARVSQLPKGRGDGTSGGVTDDSLKSRVDWLYTLIPWLIGLIVTLFVAIVVSAATTNGRIDAAAATTNGRIDRLSETTSSLSREVGVIGGKVDESNRRMDRIEAKLDAIGDQLKKQ